MKDEKDRRDDYTIASRGGPQGTRPVVIAEVEHHDATEPAAVGVRQHKERVGVRVRQDRAKAKAQEQDHGHSH